MKKKLILSMPILIIIFILCVGCNNQNDTEKLEEEKSLYDYPTIQADASSIIDELKASKQFNDIKFDEFKIDERYDTPEIRYSLFYNTNSSTLMINYDEKKDFESITLSKGFVGIDEFFSEKIFYNQILAITYLKRFDINETDFSNSEYTYNDYINFIAGISDIRFIKTNKNKDLLIHYIPNIYDFSIMK